MTDEDWSLLKEVVAYIMIPVINAVIGWGTNWLALKMTFYPLSFKGIPPYLGWQGIIPSKAGSMARKSVDMLTEKLLDVQELFSRVDPQIVGEQMEAEVQRLSRKIINEIMLAQAPLVWKTLPNAGKEAVYNRASENIPEIVTQLMADIKDNIDVLFDVKQMVVDILVENKQLLNDMFEECGKKEFKFIEISGAWLGALFGLVQAVIWYFVQHWTILPIFGVIVGYATNIIALRVIFYPLNPIKIGPYEFQGLFIKRQKEVAEVYARIVAENILTMPNIFDAITRGSASDKLMGLMRVHIEKAVNAAIGGSKPLLEIFAEKKLEVAKNVAAYRFMEELPISVRKIFGYAASALDIQATLTSKMQALSAEEFEGFLHPVFEEDEWKLILVGAILGGVAGALQIFMF